MDTPKKWVSDWSHTLGRSAAALLAMAALCGGTESVGAPLSDAADGVTCTHFNQGARIAWKNRFGDWIDAGGQPQGPRPLDRKLLGSADPAQFYEWNVTSAVLVSGKVGASELRIALVPLPDVRRGVPVASFHSREGPNPELHPKLIVELSNGTQQTVPAKADTYSDCTTNTGLGKRPNIQVGEGRVGFLSFDITRLPKGAVVRKATVRLVPDTRYGNVAVGAFTVDAPERDTQSAPTQGIAARYSGDQAIETDPQVYMATSFDRPTWRRQWTTINTYGANETFTVVERDTLLRFEPMSGPALRVEIPQGSNLGLDMRYEFRKHGGIEPEEVYFRYYLRLADDWLPQDTGKLPGPAGTYNEAGWGDRPAHPLKGWAARGLFTPTPAKDNPLHDFHTIGSYVAHAGPDAVMGEVLPWTAGLRGLLQRNQWYCIEQRVKMNRPGVDDGILQAWVDGRLAYSRTDIRFRDIPTLRVEYIWMNVYYGGRDPAPKSLHLYIDDVVIARTYIGPRKPR